MSHAASNHSLHYAGFPRPNRRTIVPDIPYHGQSNYPASRAAQSV